ncbi:protein LSM14 B-like isoform X2 [Leptotrombidium deliense]|uniref:Protein LSM14 B-like isoform X2 n=1 Tax=Leptotrombidium deliense TaxID=299467 RepID=A0A443SNM6_9ACAR|nr:protein LSM14 B-like isoform X2 [Leptotrombidium deliense]
MSIPYLGSKITLVSKSEIRYEGILYTIDPKDSTIALAKVRSFGTENRKTDKPVAPRDEVYEYIIFRASDIKDLVVEVPQASATALSDPAIIQASQHSLSGTSGGFDSATFGTSGSVNTGSVQSTTKSLQSATSSDQRSNTFSSVFNTAATGAVSAASSDNPAPAVFGSHEFRSTGSTPTPAHRRSPLSESGNQVQGHGSRDKLFSSVMKGRENRDSRQQNSFSKGRGGSSGGGDRHVPVNYSTQYRRTNYGPQRQTQQGNRDYRGPRDMPQPPRRAPGMTRPQQSYPRGAQNHRPKASGMKLDGDYDFEKANQEFQELENKLQKIKIENEKEPEKEPEEGEIEKKDEEDENVCYDKSKSFFDKISCEAIERSKGKLNRLDWKQERKLNAETFGLSHFRRGGGNFRGRGFGYRQNYYNQRNDYRGGYRQSFGGAGSGDSRRMNGPRPNRYSDVQWGED